MALLNGYLIGLSFVVFVGPVFFTLLQNTLHRGRMAGLMVALGIIVSDLIVVALCLAGTIKFLQNDAYRIYVSLLGATILLAIGLRYIFKPSLATQGHTKFTGLFGAFASGFLVNFVNPFVFGVWLTAINYGGLAHGFQQGLYLYVAGCLLGILTTDVLKVILAHRIKPLLQAQRLAIAFKVIGAVLVGFGIRLVVYAAGLY